MSTLYHQNYQLKKYRARDLSSKQIAYCEAIIAGYNSAEAYRIAGYKSDRNGNLLKCKRIKAYIARREGRMASVPVTFESKIEVLGEIMKTAITDNIKDKQFINLQAIDRGLKAIEIANVMQGHNAPTQTQAVTVNVKATQDKLIEAKKAYDEY